MGTSVDGGESIVGRTITKVRTAATEDGSVQRVTVMFDDGASLVIDGSFPACSFMVSPEDALRDIEGRRFDDLSCRSLKPHESRNGCWETSLTLAVTADGDEFTLHWKSVGRDDFDVSPEPRIHVRKGFAHQAL